MKSFGTSTSDFSRLIQNNYYYVDKTALIRNFFSKEGDFSAIFLMLRARRFGKTLTISMLRHFFDLSLKGEKNLFENLKISEDKAFCKIHQNRYPVIFLTFKDVKGLTFDEFLSNLNGNLYGEYKRHGYVKEALDQKEKEVFERIESQDATVTDFQKYLSLLSYALYQYHGIKPIVLIDEYDVPLNDANENGYYRDAVSLLSGMFSAGLKDNDNLAGAVITGCLQVAKNSIFTGMNNLYVNNVRDPEDFSALFGFTQKETQELLIEAGLGDKTQEFRTWYDGYQFGKTEIYNPFSVIQAVSRSLKKDSLSPLSSYWVNSSGDRILKDLLSKSRGDENLRRSFETLLAGGTIHEPFSETMTYDSIYEDYSTIYGFLLFTGYLTMNEDGGLRIPNSEVRSCFEMLTRAYNREIIQKKDSRFIEALAEGSSMKAEAILQKLLNTTISIKDLQNNKEDFLSGFLLVHLAASNEDDAWLIESEQENGLGYTDISLRDAERGIAIIIETKRIPLNEKEDKREKLKKILKEGLSQIEEKEYLSKAKAEGYQTVLGYAIAICGKTVGVCSSESR